MAYLRNGTLVIHYAQLVLLLNILLLYQGVGSFPVDGEGEVPNDGQGSWIFISLLSICFLATLVLLVFACGAGGCCGLPEIHWFGRISQPNTPMSFANPVAEGGQMSMQMMTPLSQIDVRALELDPVVFEPLPTIRDLTPLSSQSNNNIPQSNPGDGARGAYPQKSLPSVIPFAADESELYAHDWFDDQFPNFPRGNIEYIQEIGKGWFGQVIEAEAKDIVPFARKIRVLVKVLKEDASGIEQMRFLDESRLYRDANHGNVLKLLGHSIEKLPFLLIMDHCPQGDLKSYLIANVTRAEMLSNQGTLMRMALDIAKGLEWMSSNDFIHHDLAARNCQVGSEGRIIIGDYGLGTQIFKDDYYWNSNVAIPLRWAAPETLHCTISTIQTLKVTKLANIWTFAVVMWEITEFAKLPYFELSDEEVISRVVADKNYFLGQPTLPYISMKEELYEIMRSCWNTDPQKRPTFSSIVASLQSVLRSMNLITTPPRDEFDSKWEQLGKSSPKHEDEDKPRKKSVSFTGILEANKRLDLTTTSSNDRSFETSRRVVDPLRLDNSITETKDVEINEPTDADDDSWLHRLEQGVITKKVLEKSHSVQDLMVLTHVEPGELDADSLSFTLGSSPPDSVGSSTKTNEGGSSDSYSSSMRKSSSESRLSSSPVSSSQNESSSYRQENQPGSKLFLNNAALFSSTEDSTLNKTGVDIKYIHPTPEPQVKISLIQPTPLPPEKVPEESNHSIMPAPMRKGKVQFVFNDDPSPNNNGLGHQNGIQTGRRHTSTPKRSGSSPLPVDDSNQELLEDVFETPENTSESALNQTCPISPISLKAGKSGVLSGELMSSILVGASDDLGLNPFQGVTSQLNESANPSHFLTNEDETDFYEATPQWGDARLKSDAADVKFNGSRYSPQSMEISTPGPGPFGADLTVLGQVSNGGAMSLTPRPGMPKEQPKANIALLSRELFAEDSLSDSNSTIQGTTSKSLSSWDMVSTKDLPVSEPEVDSCVSALGNEADGGAFWSQQLQSVQEAANSTRSLFHRSLFEDEEYKAPGDKFVEDIKAADDELGSLVLHDLEDAAVPDKIVPNSTERIASPKKEVKLAFLGGDNDETIKSECSEESTIEVLTWDINNSVELKKAKANRVNVVDLSDGEMEEGQGIPKDFVPSKWNHSLAPKKAAIKSPAAESSVSQPKSSLKKSVSFDRQRPQLVYEYPPPPPITDFEEEDRLHRTANAAFPIASSLDWEMTHDDLEDAEINHEDWDEEVVNKKADPMDVYRISGVDDVTDTFQIRGSSEPFVFQPSTLGELNRNRDRLKLDLSRGEASLLDEETTKGAPGKLDSGVGSSTNVSPFNHCDMLPKTRESSDKP